jgi:hypothetical protein
MVAAHLATLRKARPAPDRLLPEGNERSREV